MTSSDSPPDHPGSPLPDRSVPNWLAAGGLFLLLGFAINAAVITADLDRYLLWEDFLHQNPDQPVSNALVVLTLSPLAGVFFSVAAGALAVVTGAIVMTALIRVLGTLPLWTLIFVVPLCTFAFALQYQHFTDDDPWGLVNAPRMIAAQTLFATACWAVYRELAEVPASPQRARSRRRILYMCATLVIAAIVVVAGVSVIVHWKPWHPEVSWSSATGLPEIAFANEWQTKTPSPFNFVSWSRDGTQILTLSYNGWLTVQETTGHVEEQKQLPSFSGYNVVVNAQEFIFPGKIGTDVAFSVVDITSGRTVFQEHVLVSSKPSRDQVTFALSPNGSVLAVVHDNIPGHPILLYDTKTWQKILTIESPATQHGVGQQLAFSADGSRLAFLSSDKFFVVDARTGQPITITAFPVRVGSFALSPDNTMVAVAEVANDPVFVLKGVRIFRLADGTQVASHAPPYRGPNCSENIEDCGLSSPILWAPSGRFLIFPDGHKMIRIWNPFGAEGKDATIRTRYCQCGIALSLDGGRLAISNGDFVSVFRVGG